MSDGVVFLPSFHEAIKELPDDERLQMYEAIILYGLYGEVVELTNPILRSLFALIKPVIDSSQRRHKASKENGKKGGAPLGNQNARKQPKNNQTNNQTNNHDIDIDIDSDIDIDTEKENRMDKPLHSPFKKYGVYGWVRLTDEQYSKLLDDFGEPELKRCIQYVDEAAQQTGNKNKWKDWNLVLRRCNREGWGKKQSVYSTDSDRMEEKVYGWSGSR